MGVSASKVWCTGSPLLSWFVLVVFSTVNASFRSFSLSIILPGCIPSDLVLISAASTVKR